MSCHATILDQWLLSIVILLLWLTAVIAGSLVLIDYEARPGQMVVQAGSWPTESRLERSSDRPTLCMFAHPRCPCTRASIEKLALLASQCRGLVDIKVLFFCPNANDPAWCQSDTITSAKTIPGVDVEFDCESSEAKRFGATISGHVMLFNPQGELMFNGGITNARGQFGASDGESRIISLLTSPNEPEPANEKAQVFPVYGCVLCEPDIAPRNSSQ